ncbi:hypothetical protein RhiXN_09440 [Rhizoctonia solani]|uniref:Uncharacterized protein n=1 Tax=Rhizoctonia solani TaxID=456999 RepID=A0A8H8NW39_9AGAM|nr:uncharacterized protein RhiXN_09440 [Rhizoctonia solani]QRW20465.1 hypothetical protein RhiXN_09440 [Rhizoctonia solani]
MTFTRPLSPSSSPIHASVLDCQSDRPRFSRDLGCNELSYFLPSRADGVNDMYLHLGFQAPPELISPQRVHAIWAVQRLRHPLLASRVNAPDASCARFEYDIPATVDEALRLAAEESSLTSSSKTVRLVTTKRGYSKNNFPTIKFIDLLSNYLNGPRLLSAWRTSFLIISRDPERLELDKQNGLPRSMEAALPALPNGLRRAIGMVDDQLLSTKQIGGQSFPKVKGATRKTVFRRSRSIKSANGVSVSSAVFALCNIAWAKLLARGVVTAEMGAKLPTLMYSALNTRPWLDQISANESFFRLNIGYFNIFIPSESASIHRTFWHRARLAKAQSAAAVKSQFIISRTQLTASKRKEQAIKWAKIDDEEAARTRTGLLTPATTPIKEQPPALPNVEPRASRSNPTPPSTALMGLSLLGNLDGMYTHAAYGPIKLDTLTTGSRQRAGAMLLFSYTFVGKLWLCFGYDENGFDRAVVEEFGRRW